MTGLSAVAARVSTLRHTVGAPVAKNPGGFASLLRRAEGRIQGAEGEAGLASPAASGATSGLIGMMGSPMRLEPENAIAAGTAWRAALPQHAAWIDDIERAALAAGLDPRLFASVVWAESGFTPDAVSPAGAIGLAQLMPGTADSLGVDPWDPAENLAGGARYLATNVRRFGSVDLGLAAYNAGPGAVLTANGIPDNPETQAYVARVLGYYESLGGSA